jgi:hypothetical protein
MIEYIIGGIITFFVILSIIWIRSKITRKKHWSEGYVVLGKNNNQQKIEEKNSSGGTDSLFPPGWG